MTGTIQSGRFDGKQVWKNLKDFTYHFLFGAIEVPYDLALYFSLDFSASKCSKPPKMAFIFWVDAVFSSSLKKAQILHYFFAPLLVYFSPKEHARPLSMAFKLS